MTIATKPPYGAVMLHLRRDRFSWGVAVLGKALAGVWDRMVASDPGLLRLGMARAARPRCSS